MSGITNGGGDRSRPDGADGASAHPGDGAAQPGGASAHPGANDAPAAGLSRDAQGRLVNADGQRVKLRRRRGLRESLVSIVMGCEVFVAFLITIGLPPLGAAEPLPAYLGGGAFILLALVAAGRAQHTWAVGLSGVLQVIAVLSGLLEPILYLVGAGFLAFWLYAVIVGTRIDRRNEAIIAAHERGEA